MPVITRRLGPFSLWSSGRMDVETPRGLVTYLKLGGHRLHTPWGRVELALRVHYPYAYVHRSYGVNVDRTNLPERGVMGLVRVAYGSHRTEVEVEFTPGEGNPFDDML